MTTRRSIEIIKDGERVVINFPSMPEKWNNNINGFTLNDDIYKMKKIHHEIFTEMYIAILEGDNFKFTFDGVLYRIDKSCKV